MPPPRWTVKYEATPGNPPVWQYVLRHPDPSLNMTALGTTAVAAKAALAQIDIDRQARGLSLLADPEPEPTPTASVGA